MASSATSPSPADGLEAEKVARLRRVAGSPRDPDALCDLGRTCAEKLQHESVAIAFRRALEIDPSHLSARLGLAQACLNTGRADEGIALATDGIATDPAHAGFWSVLGTLYRDEGRSAEATDHLRQAVRLAPGNLRIAQRLLFQTLLDVGSTPASVRAAHEQWAAEFATPHYPAVPPRLVPPRAGERWRIGYVSADWLRHPVGQFGECLLRHHDRARFEVSCYFTNRHRDERTAVLAGLADRWIEAGEMDDATLAERIRRDGIHFLVDLAGHTPGGRPLVFARQPAPVQVAYLGYPAPTGLRTIGYRLTDAWADPPGAETHWTERLVRLPETAWCFSAADRTPPVSALPAAALGRITFGGFNNTFKCGPFVVALWARTLHRVPGSRLVLRGRPFRDAGARRRMGDRFAALGIGPDRLDLQPWETNHPRHLAGYHGIDLALDTYPYHGTTTTCDALHMGVPVITLAGPAHVSRVGVSLLNQVGLADLCIADSSEDFVEKAARLAADLGALAALRGALRGRFEASALMDAPRYVRAMEAAFLQMAEEAPIGP